MNDLISKGDHSTEFHLGAVFSTQFYFLLILIINPNDCTEFMHAICTCENGHIYNWHRNKWIGVKQMLVLSVLTLWVRKPSYVEREEWESPSLGALSGWNQFLMAWSGGRSVWKWKNELFNLRRAFPSQPCCELTTLPLWPGSQLEKHTSGFSDWKGFPGAHWPGRFP